MPPDETDQCEGSECYVLKSSDDRIQVYDFLPEDRRLGNSSWVTSGNLHAAVWKHICGGLSAITAAQTNVWVWQDEGVCTHSHVCTHVWTFSTAVQDWKTSLIASQWLIFMLQFLFMAYQVLHNLSVPYSQPSCSYTSHWISFDPLTLQPLALCLWTHTLFNSTSPAHPSSTFRSTNMVMLCKNMHTLLLEAYQTFRIGTCFSVFCVSS